MQKLVDIINEGRETGEIDIDFIENQFKQHKEDISRLDNLQDYFMGKHEILNRTMMGPSTPNNKLVANHAKFITTMLTGYFMGNEVSYVSSTKEADEAVNILNDWYRTRYVGTHDYLMGKRDSIMGRAYELLYVDPDEHREIEGMPIPKVTSLDPRQTFLIRDADIDQTVLMGIHFIEIGEDEYKLYAYTDDTIYTFLTDDPHEGDLEEDPDSEESAHLFGGVPIIEYLNEENGQGDFEQVTSLIDAYNVLQSDRINDKEQLVDAILVISGGRMKEGQMAELREGKLLELPAKDQKAEWLTKSLNENEVETLKNSIKKDIHEFSFTPNLTDENFAGTTSGEAMKFKLFGTEQVLQEKETFFEKGLRLRMKRLFYYLSNGDDEDDRYTRIKIQFNRALPTDMPNPVETFVQLYGKLSTETLLGLLEFVEDIPTELERIEEMNDTQIDKEVAAFDLTGDIDEPEVESDEQPEED